MYLCNDIYLLIINFFSNNFHSLHNFSLTSKNNKKLCNQFINKNKFLDYIKKNYEEPFKENLLNKNTEFIFIKYLNTTKRKLLMNKNMCKKIINLNLRNVLYFLLKKRVSFKPNYLNQFLIQSCKNNWIECFDFLINDRKIDITKINDNKNNLLQSACIGGSTYIVRYLLKKEINFKIYNNYNENPLHIALWYKNKNLATYLVRLDIFDLNSITNSKQNVAHICCIKNNIFTLKKILEKNNKILNDKDIEGYTPLHYSTENNNDLITELLIDYECDVNIKNNNFQTPLHLACEYGNYEIVKLLLDCDNIIINKKDIYGNTPFKIAKKWQYDDIVELFKDRFI